MVVNRVLPSHYIAYKGVDDFKNQNKECCEVTSKGKEGYEIPLFSKLVGAVSDLVRVSYTVKYYDADGKEVNGERTEYVAVSNCGYAGTGL